MFFCSFFSFFHKKALSRKKQFLPPFFHTFASLTSRTSTDACPAERLTIMSQSELNIQDPQFIAEMCGVYRPEETLPRVTVPTNLMSLRFEAEQFNAAQHSFKVTIRPQSSKYKNENENCHDTSLKTSVLAQNS